MKSNSNANPNGRYLTVMQRSELTLVAMGFGLVIFGIFRVAITGLRTYLLDHTANRMDIDTAC